MKAETGMKVKAIDGHSVGIVITESVYSGVIVKVNKKSIRVHITENVNTYGSRETSRIAMDTDVTYKYKKTLTNGKDFYVSEGRIYGAIEI